MMLASRQPVTLIGGGPVPRADLDAALRLAPVIAAADRGADIALGFGLMPGAVWGDLDSISEAARKAIPRERLHLVAEQESTDFEKCLARIQAPLVLAIGFSGGRQDHFLPQGLRRLLPATLLAPLLAHSPARPTSNAKCWCWAPDLAATPLLSVPPIWA